VWTALRPPAGAFGAPLQLGFLGSHGGTPALAAGTAEHAVAAWQQSDGPQTSIVASVFSPAIAPGDKPVVPGGPGSGPAADTTGPKITVLGTRRGVRLASRRSFPLMLRLDEAARVQVTARLVVARKGRRPALTLPLLPASGAGGAQRAFTVRVKAGPASLRSLRRALRAKRRVRVAFDVVARDTAGNESRVRPRVAVRR